MAATTSQTSQQSDVDIRKLADEIIARFKACGYPPCPPPHHPYCPPPPNCPPGGQWPYPPSFPPPWPPMWGGFPGNMWWAWMMSWFISGAMPFVGGPGMNEAAWRFALTRDDFWRHLWDATGNVFQQAANASHMMGHPSGHYHHGYCPPHGGPSPWYPPCPPPWCPPHGWDPRCHPIPPNGSPLDFEKLRKDLESSSWSEQDRNRIIWAVQVFQQLASQFEKNRNNKTQQQTGS